MRLVTEFASFTLAKGLTTRAALLAEGKTPEEIQQSLGETFKLEGDKLKHFWNSLDVAEANATKLKRVVVITLNEGENAPAKATKVDDVYYGPEFLTEARPAAEKSEGRGGGRGGRGGGRGGPGGRGGGGPKSSPWGLSPEEKAAKKGGPKPS